MTVRFQMSPLFKQAYTEKTKHSPGLASKIADFISVKTQNPIQAFSKSDTPMISTGPLGRAVPGLRHAHLTQDLSLFYTVEGKNPTLIKLYGIFSHKESGTGNAPKKNLQANLGQTLANQQFTD